MTHLERLRDEGGFVHKSFIGKFVGGVIKTAIPAIGIAQDIIGVGQSLLGGGGPGGPPTTVIPGGDRGCPPGFMNTARGCIPTGGTIPMERRGGIRGRVAARSAELLPPRPRFPDIGVPLQVGGTGVPGRVGGNGVPRPEIPTLAVTGQFGAGFEASIVSREMRLCPPKTVLGVDGVCYNRRDLRNDERAWPRGRRPLLTGGEMRAVSTASAAAKKLQRKQKQLQELGLLPKPQRTRRALLPGHRATLTHAGPVSEHN